MLVLSRAKGEVIRIGADVRVVVLHVGGGRVRLGIEGPRHLRILREELYEKVVDLNRAASDATEQFAAIEALISKDMPGAADGDADAADGPL